MDSLKFETDIYNNIKKIISEVLKIDEEKISLNSKIVADLGAESLDVVTLLMEFEDQFNSKISDQDAEKLVTVGDVVKYVFDKTNAKNNG